MSMRSWLYGALLSEIWHVLSLSAQPRLEWNANLEQDLAGYRVYGGSASRQYSYLAATTLPLWIIPESNLSDRRFYAVTAFDTAGNESGYSNEVLWEPAGGDTSVIQWPANKPLRMILRYAKQDTMGYYIEPEIHIAWRQFNDEWDGQWNDISTTNNDYTIAGDTIIVSTVRLMQWNEHMQFRWEFRVWLTNTDETGVEHATNYVQSQAIQIRRPGTRGVPRDPVAIEIVLP